MTNQNNMDTFISCDWGTSAFRLRLVDAETKTVLAEVKTNEGIASTYAAWKESGENDRVCFYTKIITEGINELEQKCNSILGDTTLVLSGMVSSSIGMIDLPYIELPFRTDGSDLSTQTVFSSEYTNKMIIISGVKTKEDVMRGEETKLIGCKMTDKKEEQLFIMPGTHCKHIVVQDGGATHFKTYMTGEMFNLLQTKSILAASVEETHFSLSKESTESFAKGVTEGAWGNLLNLIFHVRTNKLFDYYTAKENYNYLSGLLIGNELKDIVEKHYAYITLVATQPLASNYLQALQVLGLADNVYKVDADEALIAGQCKVFRQETRK